MVVLYERFSLKSEDTVWFIVLELLSEKLSRGILIRSSWNSRSLCYRLHGEETVQGLFLEEGGFYKLSLSLLP